MKTFNVWLRPLGDFCRVRVNDIGEARWLLDRLSQSFVFKTFEPMESVNGSLACTFQVPYNPPLSRRAFERILGGIPEVRLMLDPDRSAS
ncbi:MAG: hypothetical protein KY476_20485 [Planctomycetes bacterium]|nr:hypothetical protein [Planctomycetota bacterium]